MKLKINYQTNTFCVLLILDKPIKSINDHGTFIREEVIVKLITCLEFIYNLFNFHESYLPFSVRTRF